MPQEQVEKQERKNNLISLEDKIDLLIKEIQEMKESLRIFKINFAQTMMNRGN